MLDWSRAIQTDSARVADLIGGAELDTTVPSCPDWSVRDLVVHLGRVQRFWAANVRAADPDRPAAGDGDPDRPAVDQPPDERLADWMRASTDELLVALDETDGSSPCWTWWGRPLTSGAVARHQVQEATVHRWDAEHALGGPNPIDPAVAHDGVAEFLEIVVGTAADRLLGSLTLVSEEGDGRWIVGDQRGTSAVVTAPASDLVLTLYGRLPPSAVRVEGDTKLLQDFLDLEDTE
jgi:uncharacterized protein (TIGR03083 family)